VKVARCGRREGGKPRDGGKVSEDAIIGSMVKVSDE